MFVSTVDPVSVDYDAHIAQTYPSLPDAQQRALATWLWQGWAVEGIGSQGEVNVTRGKGVVQERGYIRPDGVWRPA